MWSPLFSVRTICTKPDALFPVHCGSARRAFFLAALSGVCAGTFTLTFAYIADCVEPAGRASAYGLALASLVRLFLLTCVAQFIF